MAAVSRRRGSAGLAAGFTLLELLVALTLLALVMTLAAGGLRLGARSWTAGVARSAVAEDFRTGHRLLRDLVAGLRPAVIDRGGRAAYVFAGEAGRLRLVAPLPLSAGVPGDQLIWLEVAEDVAGQALRLTWRPFAGLDDDLTPPGTEDSLRLFAASGTIRFAYRGVGSEAGWMESWDAPDDMPQLIRLDMAPGRPSDTAWPALVLAPRIEAEHDCVQPRDTGLRQCRLDRR